MAPSKTAFIGDFYTVLPFKPLGLDIFPVDNSEQATEQLKKLIKSDDYAIILVTENFHDQISELQAKVMYQTTPTIMLMPEIKGSKGLGVDALRETITRALGRDIMKEEE